MRSKQKLRELYERVLLDYVEGITEQGEQKAQMLSKKILKSDISPEELICWQKDVLNRLYPDMPPEIIKSYDFFSEILKSYNQVVQEMQELRHLQQEMASEIEVAANVQSSLLGMSIPKVDSLEIGTISIPARKVNGDYFRFDSFADGSVGVGLADVMGKGLPAALCISMLKYSIEHRMEQEISPDQLLEELNKTVEENVDLNMFVSMIYGLYDSVSDLFRYASAGHEPGIYYNAGTGEFEEIETKGLLLGVNRETKYPLYEKALNIGDMLILLSDGVTESKIGNEFIEKDFLIKEFKKNIHLHPQEIVVKVCRHLMKLQHFKLRDDFTLIILKRVR